MDMQRIAKEVQEAAAHFALVEAHPTTNGGVYVKAGLHTSAGQTYVIAIYLDSYPIQMPKVYVTAPALASSPHRYRDGNICYMHPNMWNPGRHNLKYVIAQIAVWLNKYDVYQQTNRWRGPSLEH
jgi:ubiquitin-protein ligase